MERIWVADGTDARRDATHLAARRTDKLNAVTAYLYSGWTYTGWGSAPVGSSFRDTGFTGFYFDRVDDSSGPGFGAEVLLDRLASGLHFGTRCDGADMWSVDDQDSEELQGMLLEEELEDF